jgi:hypothetical protein
VSKAQGQAKLHKVMLLRDHEHAGEQHRASETIQVTEPVRNWLLAQHVIAPETVSESPTGDSKS